MSIELLLTVQIIIGIQYLLKSKFGTKNDKLNFF
jgi:hypothetical protein